MKAEMNFVVQRQNEYNLYACKWLFCYLPSGQWNRTILLLALLTRQGIIKVAFSQWDFLLVKLTRIHRYVLTLYDNFPLIIKFLRHTDKSCKEKFLGESNSTFKPLEKVYAKLTSEKKFCWWSRQGYVLVAFKDGEIVRRRSGYLLWCFASYVRIKLKRIVGFAENKWMKKQIKRAPKQSLSLNA